VSVPGFEVGISLRTVSVLASICTGHLPVSEAVSLDVLPSCDEVEVSRGSMQGTLVKHTTVRWCCGMYKVCHLDVLGPLLHIGVWHNTGLCLGEWRK